MKYTWNHRSTIAAGIAFGACFGGPLTCGLAQAGAYAIRAQQRAADNGGWRATARANAADGLFTAATFGLVKGPMLAVRHEVKKLPAWQRGLTFLTALPAATHFLGCRGRGRSWC